MTTASQRRLMETAAHSPGGYGGVVGRDIVGDDEGACAAGVILRAPDGTCLFLKRAWSSSTFPGTWCWPAGRCEGDERAEDAARRETKEETGYSAEGPLHGFDVGEAEGGKFATYVRDVPEKFIPDLGDGEHIGFAWALPSDPPEPIHPGVKATLAKDTVVYAQDKALTARISSGISLAFDRASVRTIDADGRLHVAVNNISKANVCPYLGKEIPDFEALGLEADKVYQLLRSPDELEKAATTFNNIPLLSKHVPISVDDPQQDLVIGSTGTDSQFTAPYLRNSLVVWVREAIEAIDKEEQKELSCAYRYRADMTPGTFMGVNYDGVMRDIIGNHVALVIEGRAGSDVVVGDAANPEIKEIQMTKPVVLSRRGVATLGALVVYLKPKMAQDSAFPNLYPLLTGVSTKNFKDKKAEIVAGIKKEVKLAKDANLDDLTGLLDALEQTEVMEGADADPNSGLPMAKKETDDKAALDADPIQKLKAFLKGKVSDADLEAIDKIMGDGKAADAPTATLGAPAKPAEDADKDKDKEDMVTKPAMDAAIAAASKKATEDAQRIAKDLRDAERAVNPYVGALAIACDSGEAVYRQALKMLGVTGIDDVHASALPAMLKMQPVPGTKKTAAPLLAADAAGVDSYTKMFGTDVTRIGNLG